MGVNRRGVIPDRIVVWILVGMIVVAVWFILITAIVVAITA